MEQSINEMTTDARDENIHRDRTRGKSKYMRKALVRLLYLTPEEFKAFEAKNMFEVVAKSHIERALDPKSHGNTAFTDIRDTLGERSSNVWDKADTGTTAPYLITNDIPTADRKAN